MSDTTDEIVMEGVEEYAEGHEVSLTTTSGKYPSTLCSGEVTVEEREGFGREVIRAWNEAGFNSTQVDLEHVLEWVAINRPKQYAKFITQHMLIKYT